MFKGLFSRKSNSKGTGIYKLVGEKLIEYDNQPENGSINSIIEELGFELTQVHTIHTFDSSIIECIGVKIFSKNVVFVLAKDKNLSVSSRALKQEMNDIDWDFEYSSHTIEDILNEGIEAKNLTQEFLNSNIELQLEEGNSVYLAPSLDLYLYFKDGILESYTSSEWTNAASKWLISVNKKMFNEILAEAINFHGNEIEAMEEVNLQCNALQRIPEAVNNEFIPQHIKKTGNTNFYNLLAAHYDGSINIEEFKIVNKGRFFQQEENSLVIEKFVYQFDTEGSLVNVAHY